MKTLFTHIYNHYSKPLLFLLVLLIVGGHIHNCCSFDARPEGYEYGLYASEKVNGKNISLKTEVSRTWNPKLAGISDDGWDLGVAVAIRADL